MIKIFSLDNIIRLAMINFVIFLAAFVYLNDRPKNQAQTQVAASSFKIYQELPKITGTENKKDAIVITPTPQKIKETVEQLVRGHSSTSDCWIIYSGHVYNITSYFGSHPGGDVIMAKYCGKDATEVFNTKGKSPPSPHSETAEKLLSQFLVK